MSFIGRLVHSVSSVGRLVLFHGVHYWWFHSTPSGPSRENLVLDPVSPEADDDGGSYTTYILIYFFTTLAVIIVIFAITVIAMVTIWKVRSRRRAPPKYMPLVSEKDMLDVMKKTGYVNPTYTFYSQS